MVRCAIHEHMACGAKEDQVLDAGQAVVGRAWIRARALGARGDDVGDLGKLDRAAVLEFVPQEARRAFWAVIEPGRTPRVRRDARL